LNTQETLLNDQINFDSVRVIDDEGNQKGIMSSREARLAALAKGLDLVLVAPNASPPVCKIIDWGRFLFESKKKSKASKVKQSVVDTKEIQLRPTIDTHDLETKLNQVRKFIEKGKHVRFVMKFKGREATHSKIGMDVMNGVVEELSDLVTVEKAPVFNGNSIFMVLIPQTK